MESVLMRPELLVTVCFWSLIYYEIFISEGCKDKVNSQRLLKDNCLNEGLVIKDGR